MSLTVTGGRLGGRRIVAPAGPRLRPTPARVKEAVFSILAPRLAGARVLDMYAGSGALGIEALSRGAAAAVFVEADARTTTALAATLQSLDLTSVARIVRGRIERVIARLEGPFDLIFADPPYALAPPVDLFERLLADEYLASGALLLYEHAARSQPTLPPTLRLLRHCRWGEVALSIIAAAEDPHLALEKGEG